MVGGREGMPLVCSQPKTDTQNVSHGRFMASKMSLPAPNSTPLINMIIDDVIMIGLDGGGWRGTPTAHSTQPMMYTHPYNPRYHWMGTLP